MLMIALPFSKKCSAFFFIGLLNGMHSPPQFTMESEGNDRLPFLDMLVIRCDDVFRTTIYMKPSFIGLYVQWEKRFSAKEQKLALIYSLVTRANIRRFALSFCCRVSYMTSLLVMNILILRSSIIDRYMKLAQKIKRVLLWPEKMPYLSKVAMVRGSKGTDCWSC